MGFGPEGKDKFPFGKIEREQLRQSYSEHSEARVSEERSNDPDDIYIIYDEPLSGYADSNFSLTFSPLLEHRGKTLRFFVEESLEKKRGKAVGIEFGGPGSNLFAGFTRGFFAKTLGVALTDMRDLEKKSK